MLYTKSKAIQQIKIEDIALSNTIRFESNILKHYFFDKIAVIQIKTKYCLYYWTKNNMNLLDSRRLPDWAQPYRSWFACCLSWGTGKLMSIVGPTCWLCMWIRARFRLNFEVYRNRACPLRSASSGRQYSNVLVTVGRHINIRDLHQGINVTKDADSDCSRTITGMLLLFTFTKKASTVVNFDVDISHLFTRLAGAILNSPHDIWVTGLFLQMRAPLDRHWEKP